MRRNTVRVAACLTGAIAFLACGVPSIASAKGAGVAGASIEPDGALLLEGVSAIPPVGTVGQVAVWGEGAFAVVLGNEGRTRVPIVGAGTLGRGRVMAWAHGYGSAGAAARLSTGRLLSNSCRWASGRPDSVKVALLDSDLADYLAAQGLQAVRIDGGEKLADQLKGATVLLCGRVDLSEREVRAILAFVESGGGFVCFSCPWGWSQVRHKPVSEIPLNRILTLAGLALSDGYAEPTRDGAFDATALPGAEFNAARALDILAEVEQGKRKGDDPIVKQAGATATRAVEALPPDDRILRPRLKTLLASHAKELTPGPDHPLPESQALERVLLALQLSEFRSLKPAQVRAHPAGALFPGAVPSGAAVVTRRVDVDTSVPAWHSTGLYAPPGRVVILKLPSSVKDAQAIGLRVRIGSHTDELWDHEQWRRVPRISDSWPVDGARVEVASAFGGLIYIEVPERCKAGVLEVEISGGVEAPLFVLGKTTNQQWVDVIRARPGPWSELACDRVILTIPSVVAAKIDDPTAIMEHWVKVLDADADLAGIPRERAYPQRYVADVQISAGYMHSGYPIMTHLDAAGFMTNAKGLVESGWGPYHEMGHNHQDDAWTFEGTGEVTCNIFTLYVLENVCGVADASKQKVLGDDAVRARAKYLADGARFETWQRDPFLALQMYAQVRLAFGWDVYRKVFAEYRELRPSDRPKSDEQRRDQWMIRLSRATGKNLGPFFEAWGVPTSKSARDSIADLAPWMPEEMRRKE
ncbi:MAG: M60 family metallopeptidase [Phycisphaerales bacterium]